MNDSIIKNISQNSSSILNEIISNNTQNATTIISKIDPNWFYSASAQSAAAIVGLMGAFITTKVINQNAFIKQLKKEIDEIETKIDHINDEIARRDGWVNEIDLEEDNKLVDKFLEEMLSNIDPLNPPSPEDFYKIAERKNDYQDINKEILTEKYDVSYLEKIRKYNEKLVDIFLEIKRSINPKFLSFDDLYKSAIEEYGYKYINKSTLKKKYPEYLDSLKLKDRWEILQRSMIPDPFIKPSPVIEPSPVIDPKISIRKWDKYRNYNEEIITKKGELTYLNNLLLYKKDQVESNKDFLNLKGYIRNLVIFSILGVFIPLFMLLLDYNIMIRFRFVTFFLILAGWLFIIINLSGEIRNLGD